jgi:hypothetical protein
MTRRFLYIIFILLCSSYGASFSSGFKTFGGSFGFYQDLNADVTVLNISPRFGYFLNSYLMLEGGISYVKIDIDDYNSNTYDGGYSQGNQNTTSLGARLFLEKFYVGFEFVKGFTATRQTGLGNDFIFNALNFDGVSERGLLKIGLLTPIKNNFYLDSAFHYMFILDKNERELAASNHDEFTRLAYITLGITYFWDISK